MSGRVEQLKDEVSICLKRQTHHHGTNASQGTRTQVVIAGAVAGLVSRFCVAPLDVIKIRLQLQIHSLSDPLSRHGISGPTYKGTIGTLKHILRDEGLTALWKGNVPAEGLYLAYGGLQFLSYRSANMALNSDSMPYHPSPAVSSFLSGAFAGTTSTTATYPLDLLRTRFAAQGTDRVYTSLLGSIRQIYRNEGPAGFFQGLTAANAQIIPYMGLFFTLYEAFKPILHNASLPLSWMGSADGTSGVMASVIAKTAVYPLDTVRKRLQVQGPNRSRYVHRNIPEYTDGVVGTIKKILKREGIRGMYRGLTVALLKAAPTSAITVWTFERVMVGMKILEKRNEGIR